MKALPDKTLAHYCDLYPIAARNPDSPIDVKGINPSCIRAMYKRGLIEYEFVTMNDKSERRILFTKKGLKYGCEMLALVPDNNSDNRKREVLRVYLDMGNEDHQKAWNIARSLAGERILTPTLVDLLLMHSEFLRQEDTTFAEAYPGMYKLMTEAKLEDVLGRLENLLQNTSQTPVFAHSGDLSQGSGSTQGIGGLKAIGGVGTHNTMKAVAPTFDDDDDIELEIKVDSGAGMKATQNFLKSVQALADTKPTGESTLTPRQKARLDKD